MLNFEQKQAVEHKNGPLLIVAGAGTGKTTVITERIKWLIEKKAAKPEEILALTFTEKAAKEMENRVDEALPLGTFGMWIMTFHSFCDRILKNEALQIGLDPHFKLLTEAQMYLLVKNNFWKFDLVSLRPHGNPYKFIDGMISHFSRLRDEDISVEDYLVIASHEVAKQPSDEKEQIASSQTPRNDMIELANAYKVYEKLKIDEGVMDFSDLISNTLKLFRERKNVLERYKKQFKYILVDEFQDTNFAQYELIKLLAENDSNLAVIGDDNQSIYKFRGAAISNILNFMKDYPTSKQIILSKNYRSTQTILDAAYKLIKNNDPDTLETKLGISKNLISQVKDGPAIEFIHTDSVDQEAEEVVKKIKGPNYSDYAILVRANNHADAFVRALERSNIPFQFLGPGQLFKQPEVLDLIAYLKVLANFTDSVSLYRVLSMDIFNFSQRDLIEVLGKAKKVNLSLFEMIEKEVVIASEAKQSSFNDTNGQIASSQAPRNDKFENFIKMIHKHQELINKETGGQILYFFLEDSGLLKKITEYNTVTDEKRSQNIVKFFDKLKTFESVNKDANIFNIVEYLDLAIEMGESPLAAETDWTANNAVNILTTHSAKGLEFPVVFMVNLIEGRFPTRERKDQFPVPENLIKDILPTGDFHIEEERRLFYVGMTRAKQKLYFSAANFYGEGKRERKVSPFVVETGVSGQVLTTSKNKNLSEWDKNLEPSHQNLEPLKIDYLSYSAIETFNICPLHYKLRIILKIPTPMTPSQALGNSIHLALNELYTHKTDLLESLKNNWIVEGYSSKKHEQDTYIKAQKFLSEYLKSETHLKANPIYLEQSFNFRVSDNLKIGGKIDRVDELPDGTFEIIDYKTGAKVPDQKEIDKNLQMTIYALYLSQNYPIEKIKLSFYFFETQEKVSTVRTKEQLEEAKKELLAIRDEIEKSDFKCSHHMLCDNCEFKILCG